jgi:hypothetical protein
MEEFLLPCLNKQLFGIECYGCGSQRAVLLLLDGEFTAAFRMFPAIYSVLILLIFILFNLFHRFKYDFSIKIGFILLNAAIIIINYTVKMIHFFH